MTIAINNTLEPPFSSIKDNTFTYFRKYILTSVFWHILTGLGKCIDRLLPLILFSILKKEWRK